MKDIRLTQMTKSSGWAAKLSPETLAQVLCHLPSNVEDKNLLVGMDTSDDAAVYKINKEVAIIQTLDFFTPIVDDPYTFGQIAAANSLSDIYAMGGEPKLAMNIVCFPNCLSPDILVEILKGGFEKVNEAGALLIGGHTIEDDEPKYGLSVTGFVNPDKIYANSDAKPGDVLVLTKPLGTGIINTAIKGDMADEEVYNEAVKIMTTLNKFGRDAMIYAGANGCTDITGFGFLGHSLELAKGSDVTLVIDYKKLPIVQKAKEFASMGLIPKGAYSNEIFIGDDVAFTEDVPRAIKDIMYDPQTSGGLLISVPKANCETLLKKLKDSPIEGAIIGEVIEKDEKYIIVK